MDWCGFSTNVDVTVSWKAKLLITSADKKSFVRRVAGLGFRESVRSSDIQRD